MTVVDMRNFFTECEVTLIEINDHSIYYAEEKNEEGHDSLFLLEYDRNTQTERIVANYILSNAAYQRHYFAFADELVVVMEKGGSLVWVLRIDKQTGEEKNLAQVHLAGDIADCKALDASHLLFFTVSNQENAKLFSDYEAITGFPQMVCLYDLASETYHAVRDSRICGIPGGQILSYQKGDEPWLLILQPYGTEPEKEQCYQEGELPCGEIADRVWACPLSRFLEQAPRGEDIDMDLLFCSDINGLVRYAGMDAEHLYFRTKYFPNDDQRICAVDKETGEKSVVAALNLGENEDDANFLIDTLAGQVYRVTEQEDNVKIQGVLNTKVRGTYTRELGEFVACVEDRFLIARYLMSDEQDSFEFYSIFDVKTRHQQSYESRCEVKGNTVVLY